MSGVATVDDLVELGVRCVPESLAGVDDFDAFGVFPVFVAFDEDGVGVPGFFAEASLDVVRVDEDVLVVIGWRFEMGLARHILSADVL